MSHARLNRKLSGINVLNNQPESLIRLMGGPHVYTVQTEVRFLHQVQDDVATSFSSVLRCKSSASSQVHYGKLAASLGRVKGPSASADSYRAKARELWIGSSAVRAAHS